MSKSKNRIPVLSVNEIKEVLKDCFLNQKNPQAITQCAPILWGAPGVGKSYVVNELAKELNAIVIPYFASGGDETEVDGIPVPDEKKNEARYMPLEHQNFAKYPKDQMIIWLWDEINRARPEVLQSLFKMVSTYPRMLGTREIPDNVYIIACANEGEADGTITTDFNDSSFFNKFAHFKIKFDKITKLLLTIILSGVAGLALCKAAEPIRYRKQLCSEMNFMVRTHPDGVEGVYEQMGIPYQGQEWDCDNIPTHALEDFLK